MCNHCFYEKQWEQINWKEFQLAKVAISKELLEGVVENYMRSFSLDETSYRTQ
jgi:hypothetical protein